MKVAVAIDSFKGSMTSMQAGNACKEGILAAARAHCDGGAAAVRDRKPAADNMDVVVKPLADGGEGTVEALVEGMNGTYEYVTVTDPMGSHVKARYGILSDQTAVMEMAEASGITLVKEPLNPWKAASTGVGEMILDAVQKGCRKFIIGIGGSATTEGGIGMLSALGYDFMDENGDILPPVFASLEKVVQIENNRVPEMLKDCHFQIACDVTNPLCGVEGCVYVFGAQKGVKEEEKEIIQEEKARKHKNKKADKRKVRTGGFVDEIDEEDVTGYSENGKKVAIQQTAQTAASEAHAELKKEIAAATSEEADMLSRLEMAERTVEENRKPHPAGKVEEVPEEEEEPVTIGSLAMPSYSAAQLASRVKKAGDAPDIVKDDITKVTLFDYSDIISGDVDDMEE